MRQSASGISALTHSKKGPEQRYVDVDDETDYASDSDMSDMSSIGASQPIKGYLTVGQSRPSLSAASNVMSQSVASSMAFSGFAGHDATNYSRSSLSIQSTQSDTSSNLIDFESEDF